jgi:DNA polymerase-3 subunit delta'
MTSATTQADWRFHGNPDAVTSLQHAIASGHLAHSYLITGPAGIGKATLARRLASALVCEHEDLAARPCLECRSCRHVEAGDAPDIERIGIGGVCDESGAAHRDHAADNSTRIRICQVRRLERVASLAPYAAPRRIFIVDTADDLQGEAAHALLKTLEEPPASVLLILLATDVDALLPTVRSRCQEIALRPMSQTALAQALRAPTPSTPAGIDADTAARLAREAHGCFGLALRLHTDPSLAMLRETATADAERLAVASRNERFDYAQTLAGRWSKERGSVLETIDAWRWWWRDRLLEAAAAPGPTRCSAPDAVRALQACTRAREHLLANTYPQLALEVMMLDLPVLAAQDGEEARAPLLV